MKVRWLAKALDDLEAVFEFIAEENPKVARDMAQRVWAAARALAEHPGMGRPGRVQGTRERVITGTPYLVVYRVCHEVEILRVLHGAMRWPPGDKP